MSLHMENLLATIEHTEDKDRKNALKVIRKTIRKDFQKIRNASGLDMLNRLRSEGSYPFVGSHEQRLRISNARFLTYVRSTLGDICHRLRAAWILQVVN